MGEVRLTERARNNCKSAVLLVDKKVHRRRCE